MPTIGSEDISSGISGLRHASTSIAARFAGAMRSRRDSPEPFSSTSSGIAWPRPARKPLMDCAARTALPGCPVASAPMVRKTCRAITLLLNLLMSRITSASVRDSRLATSRAPAGMAPSRTRPDHVPPPLSQRARNTAPK
jgi:hypothetical protein